MPNLFKRLSDVISANINELIDRVEDPERMIKQIIREMEENIAKAKEGVVDAIASEKQLLRDLEHHRNQSAEWLEKAEMALQNDKEELARAALGRKREHDNILKTLQPSWEAAKNTSDRLKTQLQALEAKLEEARRKKSTLVARQRAAEARSHMTKTLANFEAGFDAQANFTRMEDKVAEIEARTDAMAELNADASSLEKEFWDMQVEQDVEDDLEMLRRKLRG